jgi:hypothetical protein
VVKIAAIVTGRKQLVARSRFKFLESSRGSRGFPGGLLDRPFYGRERSPVDFKARFQRASFQGTLKQFSGKHAEARCGIDSRCNPALKGLETLRESRLKAAR